MFWGGSKSRARTLSSVILEHFWRSVPRRSQGPLRGLMALKVPYVSDVLLSVRVECAWERQVIFFKRPAGSGFPDSSLGPLVLFSLLNATVN